MVSRRYTPEWIRREVETQGHLCAYCSLPFGTVVKRSGVEITQKPTGDHFEPFALNPRTRSSNLVAACQVCNNVKGSRVFESFAEAQKAVMADRWSKGYRVWFVPATAITEDAWRWASEYAAWLID